MRVVVWMLPVAPDVVMPAVEPIPSVPPGLSANVPAPVMTLVPQLRVPPTVKVRVVATERPLFSVSDAPEGTAKIMLVVVSVPPDCVNDLPLPVKFTVTAGPLSWNVPPVWFQSPATFSV